MLEVPRYLKPTGLKPTAPGHLCITIIIIIIISLFFFLSTVYKMDHSLCIIVRFPSSSIIGSVQGTSGHPADRSVYDKQMLKTRKKVRIRDLQDPCEEDTSDEEMADDEVADSEVANDATGVNARTTNSDSEFPEKAMYLAE